MNSAAAASAAAPILSVSGLSKCFGGVVANHDISFTVPHGSIVGLIGPNGSGKTTLFGGIVGALPVDAGTVSFEGRDITTLDVRAIARLGLVRTFQQTRVYGQINCMDNMRISAPNATRGSQLFRRPPAAIDEEAEQLLSFVGLYGKRRLRAGELSFGQQKLLELAMALMSKPKMIMLDEPTAGINPTLINGIINRLITINKEYGITLLVIEHNMRVVMNLAQTVLCLAHGELLASGAADTIRNDQRVIDAYLGAE